MSYPVALQSVAFFVLACTPCHKLAHRKDAAKQARKDREKKAQLETEQPKLYRHPSPFNTNPFWDEEIEMGPRPPKKGRGSKNPSHGQLDGTRAVGETPAPGGTAASIASSSLVNSTDPGSSPTVVPEEDASCDQDWNHKRYEREDEELWGHGALRAGYKLREAIVKAGESARGLLDTTLGRTAGGDREVTNEDRHNFYFAPKNPPVNDYHPPVVSSMPTNKREYEWMLQPPPPAKFMEGKEPVKRTASTTSSMASRRTVVTGAGASSREELGLGRLVGAKLVNDKLKKGRELPTEAELTVITSTRPNARRTRTNSTLQSQRSVNRSRSNTTESEGGSSDTILERRRKKRMSQQQNPIQPGSSESDEDGDDEGDKTVAQRPKLETIASSRIADTKAEALEELATMSEPAHSPKPLVFPRIRLNDNTSRPSIPVVVVEGPAPASEKP